MDNLSVAPEVIALLPGVLIAYIWNLARCQDRLEDAVQHFSLVPAELGGRNIQDITYAGDRKRVFGIDPVRCKLRIFNANGQYQMTLER